LMAIFKKENTISEQQASNKPQTESKRLDIGETWSQVTFSKFVVGVLALLTLLNAFFVSRSATPGHGAPLLLGWVLVNRLWVVGPSRPLLGFCLATSIACVSANHGLFMSVGILHSFYFYAFTCVLILYWERIKRVVGLGG
jgi:hypothetical protein